MPLDFKQGFIVQFRPIGQKRSYFGGLCSYRTKWRLSALFNRETILYKPYLILHFHPVMTP